MTLQRDLQIVLLELENIRERCKFLNDQERIDDAIKILRPVSMGVQEIGDPDGVDR